MLTKPQPAAAEGLLLDYSRHLDRHRQGRSALWIHLSRLEPRNRHEADLQLGANVLRPLARRYQGEVFALGCGDIVVCLKDAEKHAVEVALAGLRSFFSQDPLMKRAEAEGQAAYLTHYDMANSYAAFFKSVIAACTPDTSRLEPPPAAPEAPAERLILTRQQLRAPSPAEVRDHVDTSQGRIAVERLFEHQPIGELMSETKARAWGRRDALHALALDAFAPLAMAVARRQIAFSAAQSEIERLLLSGWGDLLCAKQPQQVFLFLRLETLMSAEFLMLDRAIEETRLRRPSIALFPDDALEDAATVDYVRGFLRERGYRLGLGAVALKDLTRVGQALAGMSFLELALPSEVNARDAELLARLVGEWGAKTVLAAGVATPQTLETVYKAGIRLVSGAAIRL